jgi:hypothetical protein
VPDLAKAGKGPADKVPAGPRQKTAGTPALVAARPGLSILSGKRIWMLVKPLAA